MGIDVSISNTTVVVNGHTVSGWSEDTDALLLPDLTIANIKRGGDGRMTSSGTGDQGGPVTFKLLPTSPSTQFFMNLGTTQRSGGSVEFNGTVRYNDTGIVVELNRGIMTQLPSGQTVGKGSSATQMFIIEFESVVPDYSAANLETIASV